MAMSTMISIAIVMTILITVFLDIGNGYRKMVPNVNGDYEGNGYGTAADGDDSDDDVDNDDDYNDADYNVMIWLR